jgi:hypothetical protein
VSWRASIQSITALSTTEAEYVSATDRDGNGSGSDRVW